MDVKIRDSDPQYIQVMDNELQENIVISRNDNFKSLIRQDNKIYFDVYILFQFDYSVGQLKIKMVKHFMSML